MGTALSHPRNRLSHSVPVLSRLWHLPCHQPCQPPPAPRTAPRSLPELLEPPAAQETFCCLQDGAKSPLRLKIPSDWPRFGAHPRQTEQNPGQAPAAGAASPDPPGAAAPGER